MKLDQEIIGKINQLKAQRDSLAYRLGVLTVEYEQNKSLTTSKIDECSRKQEHIGLSALKELGLDVDKNDYSVQDDGTIKVLKAGVYVDIED